MKPGIRIQRTREEGFDLQAQSPDGRKVVSCTRPHKWGNPFRVVKEGGAWYVKDEEQNYWGDNEVGYSKELATNKAISLHSNWLEWQLLKGALNLEELRDKHLACFCAPGTPCHVDNILLLLANPPGYAAWKKRLIEVTEEELKAAGIPIDFKINDTEAQKCFESGMTPFLCFRENYGR